MKSNHLPIIDDFKNYLPGISVDCIILGYKDNALRVLLLEWKHNDDWVLPGGFVLKDEDLDAAALRVLRIRTGIDFPVLQQFKSFGSCDRTKPEQMRKILDFHDISDKDTYDWFTQRFVSVGYIALVNPDSFDPQPDFFSKQCKWRNVKRLPKMSFDHKSIVSEALSYLRNQINFLPVADALLPQEFTIRELQLLYESILDKKLDRANFQKKILKLDVLRRNGVRKDGQAHKSPFVYKFDKKAYKQLLKKGIGIHT